MERTRFQGRLFYPYQEKRICILYQYGWPISEILKEYCRATAEQILEILKKNGVYKRCENPRINHGVFNKITKESAYWIGFLMADGCIQGNQISVNLGGDDYYHLLRFLIFVHWLGTPINYLESKIYVNKSEIYASGSSARIAFTSQKMVKRLAECGVVPLKSAITEVKLDKLKFNKHFWRGVIDGDGHIGIDKNPRSYCKFHLGNSGSKTLMEQYKTYIKTIVPRFRGSVRKHPQGENTYTVQTAERIAQEIAKELYGGANIYLERKMEIAKTIINYEFPPYVKYAHKRKLCDLDIPIIRRLYKDTPLKPKQIAKMFGVSQSHIYGIVRYQSWKNVP